MTTYRLSSTPGVYTPGLVRYIQEVGKSDDKMARELLFAAFPTIPGDGVEKLLTGKYVIDKQGEAVEVEVA